MEKTLTQALVRVNAKEGLAKSDKASNVQNRIWHELMQLHTVHKEEPTKKLVGRKRKSAEEKGMILVMGKMISANAARKPSSLAFARSASAILDAVQPRACFLVECFAIGVQ
jgi:hypothetical protein